MINFLGKKLNRRIFSVVLLGVLVFGGVVNTNKEASAVLWDSSVSFDWNSIVNTSIGKMFSSYGSDMADDNAYSLTLMGASDNDNIADEAVGPSVWLLKMASNFLMWTVSPGLYDKVFFSPIAKEGITQAWEAVRGFINMFYLLILVFLAITTILRINKFNDKKLFFNVIVSAILVNFSMAITLVVIDFSNLIMTYFASAIQDVNAVGTFFANSHYAKTIVEGGQTSGGSSFFLEKGSEMIGFIINIIMAVMILFVAISLLIRLIAYWVLIILSPLAFFSIALPGSNGFTEWKDKLIHYSFYGPIMLFFIWLSMALTTYLEDAFTHANDLTLRGDFVTFLTSYITALYLLYYGHEKSTEMAKKAGDFAGKIMDKGGQYAVKAGKYTATGGHIGMFAGGAVKSRAMEGAWTKNLFKAGREESKKEFDRKSEYFGASKDKKKRMQMEDINKTKVKMKEKYDLESTDTLKGITQSGTTNEKRVAYLELARKGELKGPLYKEAMKIAGNNEIYKSAINRSAGGKNKVAMMDYQIDNYEENKKSIDGNIEKYNHLMEETGGSTYTIDPNNIDKAKLTEVARIGAFTSMNDTAVVDLINEEKEKAVEITKQYMEYNRIKGDHLTQKGKEILLSKIKERSAKSVVGRYVPTAGGGQTTESGIHTGTDRQSSVRSDQRSFEERMRG